MGIVNVTPDSFADGGDRFAPEAAIAGALDMARQGADLIDIGAESTRPGAVPLPAAEELRRLVPVLEGLRGRLQIPISVDTYKAEVAERAIYADPAGEVAAELRARVEAAEAAGIPRTQVIVDPGLGFAKRAEHSLAVLAALPKLATLGCPILVGPSRKSFLKAAIGDVPAGERQWGTAAAVTAAVLFGAHIVRVHDVRAMVDVVRVADAIRQGAV